MPGGTRSQTASRVTCLTRLRMNSVRSGNTALVKRGVGRLALFLTVLFVGSTLGSATSVAAELGDYLWESRPLLLFAPTDSDPRLVETVNRIEASRCEAVNRDMVVGVVVTEGTSTLDGQAIDADEANRLMNQFAIGEDAFTVVLIGKDGGEKLRVTEVPDLGAIYSVIDGMPMRSREASNRC